MTGTNAAPPARIDDAGFPRDKRLEALDFEANTSVSAAVIRQLVFCALVKAAFSG